MCVRSVRERGWCAKQHNSGLLHSFLIPGVPSQGCGGLLASKRWIIKIYPSIPSHPIPSRDYYAYHAFGSFTPKPQSNHRIIIYSASFLSLGGDLCHLPHLNPGIRPHNYIPGWNGMEWWSASGGGDPAAGAPVIFFLLLSYKLAERFCQWIQWNQ